MSLHLTERDLRSGTEQRVSPASAQSAGEASAGSRDLSHSSTHTGALKLKGNPSQNEAITHRRGPMLCLAGPGSGKTFTLVQHILFLILEEHVPPSKILVLTFSKAAALEMQQRYQRDLQKLPAAGESSPPGRPFFGTFHALFYRILRENSNRPIELADTKTRTQLVTRLLQTFTGRAPSEQEVTDLLGKISSYKNGTLSLDEAGEGGGEGRGFLPRVLAEYRLFMEENGLIDFDDMALDCMALLSGDPQVLKRQQERFLHILVDEFQDINAIQLRLTLLLARPHGNIFAVGDDDQSIYGFRGADPFVFRRFLEACPDAHRVTLSVNYRCQARVLAAAGKVIRENKNRMPKTITAGKDPGEPVVLRGFASALLEAKEECAVIRRYLAAGGDPASCAVIVRTHAKAREEEKNLLALGIPVSGTVVRVPPAVYGVIRDIRDYFVLALDLQRGYADADHIRVIMNRPRRWLLGRDAGEGRQSPREILAGIPASSPARKDMGEFLRDVSALASLSPRYALSFLRCQIGLEAFEISGSRRDAEDIGRTWEDAEHLAASCGGIPEFLASLDKEEDRIRKTDGTKKSDKEGIRIMTMHACKGLEFSLVILPDLNEGVIPGMRARESGMIEEERRLLYVAMTRARDALHLYWVENDSSGPSGFLAPLLPAGKLFS